MTRKSIAYPYLALGLTLFCWISFPKSFSDQARSFTVASFTPIWKCGEKLFLNSSTGMNEEENQALGNAIIAKNSPVVLGASLVGVVDFVGKKQSRIRLITDSGLSPSVRAVRGAIQNRELAALLQTVLSRVETREDLFSSI